MRPFIDNIRPAVFLHQIEIPHREFRLRNAIHQLVRSLNGRRSRYGHIPSLKIGAASQNARNFRPKHIAARGRVIEDVRSVHDIARMERRFRGALRHQNNPLVVPVIQIVGRIQPHAVMPDRAALTRRASGYALFVFSIPPEAAAVKQQRASVRLYQFSFCVVPVFSGTDGTIHACPSFLFMLFLYSLTLIP